MTRFGRMIEPRYLPLIGYTDGWSASTAGEIVAAPMFVGGKSPPEMDGLRAQLKGAIVRTKPILTNFVRKTGRSPATLSTCCYPPAMPPASASLAPVRQTPRSAWRNFFVTQALA
jgi:hypothetical protein